MKVEPYTNAITVHRGVDITYGMETGNSSDVKKNQRTLKPLDLGFSSWADPLYLGAKYPWDFTLDL